MKPFDDIQEIVARLQSETVALEEVRAHLDHSSAIVRAGALRALAKHAERDPNLLADFVVAAKDPRNEVRLMGTISVAHEAVAWLLRIDGHQALEMAGQLIESWPESDRDDLLWYLNSEDLLVFQASDQRTP